MPRNGKLANLRGAMASYLDHVGKGFCKDMPIVKDHYLPFFKKQEMYSNFLVDYTQLTLYDPAGRYCILGTWNLLCNHIKMTKISRLIVCDTSAVVQSAIQKVVEEVRRQLTFC